MVLVIIGLIVGGVLVGQDLIKAAQIRAQVTQFEKWNTAINTFHAKYDCLPGDCPNATQFFPSLIGTSYTNGDGNGLLIDNFGGTNTTGFPFAAESEPTLFWVHLWEAGLASCCNPANIGFNGTAGWVIGQTFPQDKVNGYGVSTGVLGGRNGYFWGITTNCSTSYYCAEYGNNSNPVTGVLTPLQAQAFDTKIDDGLATTGNVYAAWLYGGDDHVHPQWYHAGYNCLTNASPAAYNSTYSPSGCSLWINMQGM